MVGLLEVKRDRGYAVRRDEKERPKGNQRTSLRSDHDGVERALTMRETREEVRQDPLADFVGPAAAQLVQVSLAAASGYLVLEHRTG